MVFLKKFLLFSFKHFYLIYLVLEYPQLLLIFQDKIHDKLWELRFIYLKKSKKSRKQYIQTQNRDIQKGNVQIIDKICLILAQFSDQVNQATPKTSKKIGLYEIFLVDHIIQMKLSSIIFIFFIISLASATGKLWFNSKGLSFRQSGDNFRCFVPVQGGSKSYYYRYYNYPDSWDIQDNNLIIPRNKYAVNKRYRVSVSVYDIYYQVSLKKTLVFYFSKNFKVTVKIQAFQEDISGIRICYFPSNDIVQDLIDDGDIEGIRDVIDSIIACQERSCESKANFLRNILNKISLYINLYDSRISDLSALVKRLKNQLSNLEKEEDKLSDQKKRLGNTIKLTKELKNLQKRKTFLNKRIKDDRADINKNNNKIKDLRKQIWNINEKNVNPLKKKIKELEWKVRETKAKINKKQGDIPWLKKQLKQHEKDLAWKKNQLKKFQKQIDGLEGKIKWFEKKNVTLNKRIKSDQAQINRINKKIKDIQREIGDIKEDAKKIMDRLQQLEDAIRDKKNQIRKADFDIVRAKDSRQELEGAFENFESIIQRYYHQCFNAFSQSAIPIYYGSQPWRTSYGIVPYNQFNSYSYSCTSIVRQSYIGVIRRIHNDLIYVVDKFEAEFTLYVHTCTVLSSSTGFNYPRVNDQIQFTGEQRGNSRHQINLNQGYCY